MTDYISLTIVRGRDGGLSVHENIPNEDQVLVFAGDTKQVTAYFEKRASSLAAGLKSEAMIDFEPLVIPKRGDLTGRYVNGGLEVRGGGPKPGDLDRTGNPIENVA
jgi:hypothetical protein